MFQINNLYTKIDITQCTKTLKNTVKASEHPEDNALTYYFLVGTKNR